MCAYIRVSHHAALNSIYVSDVYEVRGTIRVRLGAYGEEAESDFRERAKHVHCHAGLRAKNEGRLAGTSSVLSSEEMIVCIGSSM